MSLIILIKPPTVNILSRDFFKSFLKLLLHRFRGPRAVTSSLLRGLKKIKVDFIINSYDNFKKDDIVFVNESVPALRYAINLKKTGKISRLVVGPNFVINPNDENAIMRSPEIDLLLFPCEWVMDYWLTNAPELEKKYAIWPAGVSDRGEPTKNHKRDTVLVYYKNCPPDLLKKIINYLRNNKIFFQIIRYGHFRQREYFNILDQTIAVIYLSNSESQGLAMFEAWERNVPTLVWDRGYAELCGKKYFGASSAPYLSIEAGVSFKNEDEFINKIEYFLKKSNEMSPRRYILDNFTDELCTQNFLEIIR